MQYLFFRERDSRKIDAKLLARITAGFSCDRYFVAGVNDDDPEDIKPCFLGSIHINDNDATFFAKDGRIVTWNRTKEANQ